MKNCNYLGKIIGAGGTLREIKPISIENTSQWGAQFLKKSEL